MRSSRRLRLLAGAVTSGLRGVRPPVGAVRLGSLRRTTPISWNWGFDRGLPVDRYYIERFLERHAADIQGQVLEFGDDAYTRRFGGSSAGGGAVTGTDVFDVDPSSTRATIVGDLSAPNSLRPDAFDCVICTQTLQLIYDLPAAVRALHQGLRPGGVALVTASGISPIHSADRERWGWYWNFTTGSAQRLFAEHFAPGELAVHAYGNVLSAVAFLHGLASEELLPSELDVDLPEFEVLVAVRAVKADT